MSRVVEPMQFLKNDLRHGISLTVNLRPVEPFGHAAAQDILIQIPCSARVPVSPLNYFNRPV